MNKFKLLFIIFFIPNFLFAKDINLIGECKYSGDTISVNFAINDDGKIDVKYIDGLYYMHSLELKDVYNIPKNNFSGTCIKNNCTIKIIFTEKEISYLFIDFEEKQIYEAHIRNGVVILSKIYLF